ncbi:MAG: class I tRNA ligase family protein, partial [Oscillospiraceae bacterium]|nr:class I tRNA ligase family protein [Oscillospiraceae bacterium]
STLTGETPVMRDAANWYFKLTDHYDILREYAADLRQRENVRQVVHKTISEFLEPPVIYIMNDFREKYEELKGSLEKHELVEEPKKTSFTIVFDDLTDREKSCEVLSAAGVRFRTGKTLVPFRLTGNIEWGVPAPVLEDEDPLTIWVWPESLWAPISFTQAYLESVGKNADEWKKYWCSKDAQVYQFIGQDNIYFYGVAEMAMFMALQGKENLSCKPDEGELQLPILVANHHILFLDKKASSSGTVKPPMAAELLDYYTAEQLRMHFLSLGLGMRSVSFQPKPLNPNAKEDEGDPVVKEGFLLSNVFNRIIRTCFYDAQKYLDGKMPVGKVDDDI